MADLNFVIDIVIDAFDEHKGCGYDEIIRLVKRSRSIVCFEESPHSAGHGAG